MSSRGESGQGPDSAATVAAWINANTSGLPARMGITVHEASADRVVATMPVEGNTQPYGLLHGGASCVLAETLGSVGSALHAGAGGPDGGDRVVVGVDINATHHRAVRSGTVTGVASALHRGRSIASYEVVITDEGDRRVCTARITCLIRSGPVPG